MGHSLWHTVTVTRHEQCCCNPTVGNNEFSQAPAESFSWRENNQATLWIHYRLDPAGCFFCNLHAVDAVQPENIDLQPWETHTTLQYCCCLSSLGYCLSCFVLFLWQSVRCTRLSSSVYGVCEKKSSRTVSYT